MTFNLTMTSGGVVVNLDDRAAFSETKRWRLRALGDNGLGLPALHRLNQRGPLQDGESDDGVRLDARVFDLPILIESADDDGYWDARKNLLKYCTPNSLLTFALTVGTRPTLYLDAYAIGGLRLAFADRAAYNHRDVIQFRAPNPTLYTAAISEVFGVGGGGGSFTIPLAIPWAIGSSVVNQSRTIAYDGDWLDYPIITITGPITNPKITHQQSGTTLDLTGYTVAIGEIVTIDLRYGAKTITNNSGVNLLNYLSTSSDIATFALLPHPLAADGANGITVTGSGATAATEIYINYRNRYLGI